MGNEQLFRQYSIARQHDTSKSRLEKRMRRRVSTAQWRDVHLDSSRPTDPAGSTSRDDRDGGDSIKTSFKLLRL